MIIVVDKMNSGLGIAAQARASLFGDVKVVSVFEFCSPFKLFRYLLSMEDKVVLFSWRGALSEIVQVLSYEQLEILMSEKSLGASVADHSAITSSNEVKSEVWMNVVDFICVTNSTLFELYCSYNPQNVPIILLKDLPNLTEINKIAKVEFDNRSIDIIWIGNSAWGERQGYRDHKGLKELFIPATEMLLKQFPNLVIEIVDSATNPLKHEEVLFKLANSKILVQTSKHEGTGLPVLEALTLGCRVVTTPVGISSSLAGHDAVEISDFEPSAVAKKILKSLSGAPARFDVESYIYDSPNVNLTDQLLEKSTGIGLHRPVFLSLFFRIKWWLRCVKHKFLRAH